MSFTNTSAYNAALAETASLRKNMARGLLISGVIVLAITLLAFEPSRNMSGDVIAFIFSRLWSLASAIHHVLAPSKWAFVVFDIATVGVFALFLNLRTTLVGNLAHAYLLQLPGELEGCQAQEWAVRQRKGFACAAYGLAVLASLTLLSNIPNGENFSSLIFTTFVAGMTALIALSCNSAGPFVFSIGAQLLRERLQKEQFQREDNRLLLEWAKNWLTSDAGLVLLDKLFVCRLLNLFEKSEVRILRDVLTNVCTVSDSDEATEYDSALSEIVRAWRDHHAAEQAANSVGMTSEAS